MVGAARVRARVDVHGGGGHGLRGTGSACGRGGCTHVGWRVYVGRSGGLRVGVRWLVSRGQMFSFLLGGPEAAC